MKKAIIGRKVGMTQIFTEEGKVIPVTVIEAGPVPSHRRRSLKRMATTLFSSASRMSRSASSRSRRSAT